MICTTSIRNLGDKRFDGFVKLAIVRSMKRPIADVAQYAPLSPDWSLFKTYRQLAEEGKWGVEAFETVYRPRFLAQMESDPVAKGAIDALAKKSWDRDIVLACFCADVRTCHRSLVAELLVKAHADMGEIA